MKESGREAVRETCFGYPRADRMEQEGEKMKIKLWEGIVLLTLITLCGCTKSDRQEEKVSYEIALLGKEDYVNADENFVRGIKMAFQDQSEKVDVSWKYYDDKGDYETGLALAKRLAKDARVAGVLSFQDYEVLDAELPYFKNACKPVFAVQGCYEETLEKKSGYLFSGYLSSKDMGEAMAKYCKRTGHKRIVCSHTRTTFETEEVIGFCNQAEQEDLSIVDMMNGPEMLSDLQTTYEKWKTLGVDTLYICRYIETLEQKEWIYKMIRYIKQKDKDFLIIGDYSLDSGSYLEKYGMWMDGTAYPEPYSVEDTDMQEAFVSRFCRNYQLEKGQVTAAAFQGYDMASVLISALEAGAKTGKEIRDWIVGGNHYQWVSGAGYSKENKLQSRIQYRVFSGNAFQLEEVAGDE